MRRMPHLHEFLRDVHTTKCSHAWEVRARGGLGTSASLCSGSSALSKLPWGHITFERGLQMSRMQRCAGAPGTQPWGNVHSTVWPRSFLNARRGTSLSGKDFGEVGWAGVLGGHWLSGSPRNDNLRMHSVGLVGGWQTALLSWDVGDSGEKP